MENRILETENNSKRKFSKQSFYRA